VNTDAVERDLWIISTQLMKLGESFGSLAAQLTKDRKFGSKSVMRRTTVDENPNKTGAAAEPVLPFGGPFD